MTKISIMFFTVSEFIKKSFNVLTNKFISVGISSALYAIFYVIVILYFSSIAPYVNKYGIFVVIADLICAFCVQKYDKCEFFKRGTELFEVDPDTIEYEPIGDVDCSCECHGTDEVVECGCECNKQETEEYDIQEMQDLNSDVDTQSIESETPITENIIQE